MLYFFPLNRDSKVLSDLLYFLKMYFRFTLYKCKILLENKTVQPQ